MNDALQAYHLQLLHQRLSQQLAEIAESLPPNYRLTLVARHTAVPNAQIIVTEEKIADVIAALERPISDTFEGYNP